MNFVIFFRISDDPEIYELLADVVKRNIARLTTDQILSLLVNFSHSLSPETVSVFEVAAGDFVFRLDGNFNATSRELYVKLEDFPKIINVFSDHGQLSHELKEKINDYLTENVHNFNY